MPLEPTVSSARKVKPVVLAQVFSTTDSTTNYLGSAAASRFESRRSTPRCGWPRATTYLKKCYLLPAIIIEIIATDFNSLLLAIKYAWRAEG